MINFQFTMLYFESQRESIERMKRTHQRSETQKESSYAVLNIKRF